MPPIQPTGPANLERAIALSEVLGVPVDKLFNIELKTRHVE